LKSKQQGMTLVEVLIASIILFISISVISMVARTKILNEQKLIKAINQAYLAEFSQGTIKYHLQYTQDRQGRIVIAGNTYLWSAQIKDAKPAMRALVNSDGNEVSSNDSLLTIYSVVITREGSEKQVFEFAQLLWKSS